ncbi:Gibberella pigment 3 [Hyphodiscus hymeniophilus]|uniref:Gibberella pigment 3 n=1 Tax=Hyphodiscus hymeniophilus TaxID=353542 RepID=A0A9P7B0Q5_9HELO|nr:Gibberella pigment 3 [Hyphodiscus hymeniophilus]
MGSSSDPRLTGLKAFLQGHPEIQYATPTSSNYEALRKTYILDNPAVPLAIVRPQNAEDVAALVTYAKANGLRIAVRSGGNSLFGKSMVNDALIVDMRDIAYVKLNESKTLATVGGGIIMGDLANELTKQGLATAMGTIPFVGFVGWSTYGGYGPFSPQYGLGCDNIVGAKVVNFQAEVIEADEEMLRGIRGAGGAFGPIVEMTVKVYQLKNILGGLIIFDSTDILATARKVSAGYQALQAEGLPSPLYVQQFALTAPFGKIFALAFFWGSDDHEQGQAWLTKVAALGDVIMNTVTPNTLAGFLEVMKTAVPPNAYGSIETMSIRGMTPEAIEIIARNIQRMPSTAGTSFSMHELRGSSAVPKADSIFASREPHMMLEIITTVADKTDLREAQEWAQSFLSGLREMDPENILPGTYISVTAPGSNSFENIFGVNYKPLLEMKRKWDPEGIYALAPPEVE